MKSEINRLHMILGLIFIVAVFSLYMNYRYLQRIGILENSISTIPLYFEGLITGINETSPSTHLINITSLDYTRTAIGDFHYDSQCDNFKTRINDYVILKTNQSCIVILVRNFNITTFNNMGKR